MSNLNGRSGRRVRICAARPSASGRAFARRSPCRRRSLSRRRSSGEKEREETNGGGGDIHGARRSAPPSSRDRASAGRQGTPAASASCGAGVVCGWLAGWWGRASCACTDGLRVVAATKGAGPRGELVGPSSQWVRGIGASSVESGRDVDAPWTHPASEASGHLGAGCAPGRGVGRPGPVAPSSSAAGARCGRGMGVRDTRGRWEWGVVVYARARTPALGVGVRAASATPTTQARAARAPTPARPAAPPAQTQAEDGDRQLALVVQVGVPVSGGVDVHHIESGATRGKGEGREDQGRRGERAVEGRGHLESVSLKVCGTRVRLRLMGLEEEEKRVFGRGTRHRGASATPSTSCPFPVRMAGGATSMVQGSMGETKKARKFHLLMPGTSRVNIVSFLRSSRRWAPYLNVLALALPHCPAQRTTEMPLGACARAGGAVGHGHHAGHDNHTRPTEVQNSKSSRRTLRAIGRRWRCVRFDNANVRSHFCAPHCEPRTSWGRKRRRTQAQARERAKIYRLDPADQICALLAIEEDHVRYFREGPGTVYFTAQHDDGGQLIVKWGESACLARRQLEYDECGVGQTQMWFGAFEVGRRLLAERVIRLALIGEGYTQFRFEEPCSCGRCHREYHWMRPGGSLEEIEIIARECLAIIEEPTIIRSNPREPKPARMRTFARVGGEVAEQAGALRSVGRWAGGVDTSGSDCEHLRASGGGTEPAGTLRSGGRWLRRHGRRAFIEALIKTSLCNRVGIT
ncbi:hypothetical protein B0H14DRAFT_2646193 [Mycena olivaceomarginata]|nr:hypothetical protein B0H14DRAFT_2646193 [Mycena olivaceomarginata]